MTSAAGLSVGSIDALERALRRVAPETLDGLKPGLADDRIDELLEPLGLRMPAEARVWWRWNNANGLELFPFGESMALEVAVRVYQSYLSLAELATGDSPSLTPEDDWPRTWCPLLDTGGRPRIAIDLGVSPCPVYFHSGEDLPSKRAWFGSLGELVRVWTGALDTGAATFNGRSWVIHDETLKERVRPT